MARAISQDISEIKSGGWLRDLAFAMKPIGETLTSRFMDEATDDTKTDPNRYIEASAKIREMADVLHPAAKARIARGGAFAA